MREKGIPLLNRPQRPVSVEGVMVRERGRQAFEHSGPERHTRDYHPLLYEYEMRSGFCESEKITK